jgi:1-acyl-sn-glycerol-3-phosphate acyltransferase
MLRMAFLIVVTLVDTLVFAPVITIVGLVRSTSPFIDRLIHAWARVIVRAAGLDISVSGTEHLDPGRRYIVIANHASYLDIPVLFAAIRQPLRFMAKKSLFSVPIFGWGLKAAGFIPVDRKKSATASASFDLATSRLAKGNSLVIFPEGGRSRSVEMSPFKRGAFLLALKSGLPIVPVGIVGTWDALPSTRFIIEPGAVEIRIGTPIETADLGVRRKDELMATAREEISQLLEGTRQAQTGESKVG